MSSRAIRVSIYNSAGTTIEYDNINGDFGVQAGSMSLDTQIMDTELRFGDIYSSKFEIQIFGLDLDLSGRKIRVQAKYDYENVVAIVDDSGNYLVDSDGNILVSQNTEEQATYRDIFTGYIDTCTKDAIATDRNLVAYDIMYYRRDDNISTWFDNYVQSSSSNIYVFTLMDDLLTHMNISHDIVPVYFDYMIPLELSDLVGKVATLTFGQLLSMCCELLLVCPHITGSGTLSLVTLSDSQTRVITDNLEGLNSEWADYTTDDITGVVFYSTGDDILVSVGTNVNQYKVASNILLLELDATDLASLANVMLTKLATIKYIPCKLKLITSQMNYNLGNMVITKHGYCYIMKQSFYGSILIEHEIECNGDKTLATDVKNFNQVLLEGYKTSKIEQDIDKINLEVGESTLVNLPVLNIDTVTDDTSGNTIFEITTSETILGCITEALYDGSYKFGVTMPTGLTSTQMSNPKILKITDGSATLTSSINRATDDGFVDLTNEFTEGDILYLEATSSKTAGTSTANGIFVITDGYSQAQVEVIKNKIVLKVDSGNNLVLVELGADASTGSVFTVGADNISLTATQAINFMAGGDIDLSGKNITISADNFEVTADGEVTASKFNVVATTQGAGLDNAFSIIGSDDTVLGTWGTSTDYSIVNTGAGTFSKKASTFANYFKVKIDAGSFHFDHTGFIKHEDDVFDVFSCCNWATGAVGHIRITPYHFQYLEPIDMWIPDSPYMDITNTTGWGVSVGSANAKTSLRETLMLIADMVKVKTFDINNSSMSGNSQALGSYVSLDSGYRFLSWLQPASSGWVTTFPIYIATPESSGASAFWSGTLPSGSNYKIHFAYLEIRDL